MEQSLVNIRRALEKGLVSSPEGLKDEESDRLRITSAGAYIRKKLCALFSYLDAVIVDTPIVDIDARGEIHDVRSIEDRLMRAEKFIRYLDNCWQQAPELHDKLDWPSLSGDARRQLSDIRIKLDLSV